MNFQLTQVRLGDLEVTSGSITELEPTLLSIQEPITRATMTSGTAQIACIQFCYLGPTSTRRNAGSGAELHQIGLKLRSKDPCNLLYVMWRIQPTQELIVQTKRNEKQSTSEECGNNGYETLARTSFHPFHFGEIHELMAEIETNAANEGEMRCWVDWQEVARTTIDSSFIGNVNGPPGIRSDNGQYNFRFFTATL